MRGLPLAIRVDDGPEYISGQLKRWAQDRGIGIRHIQPGKLQQNAYVERYNRTVCHEWLLAEAEELAIKELIAEQIVAAMEKQGVTKTAMALRMHTSRHQLERLLDPENPSVTLSTLRRAATAVGRKLRVELA